MQKIKGLQKQSLHKYIVGAQYVVGATKFEWTLTLMGFVRM